MPRKEQGWITFQSTEEERKLLEEYCQQAGRTKTEILRELVRSLGNAPSPDSPIAFPPKPARVQLLKGDADLKAMRLSARNVLKGQIRRIIMGPVDTEVSIALAPGVEIASVITTASAEQLGLRVKQTVYAVIKSSSVTLVES
ncbi:molybdopterin-binding protein [Pannus brasiliensis CCIBt3594]|uniref:Molybdopterin-binding protein n=1 Tax=Pannus brasiliensis CCIBt3594 TaxID=1427578 RepID=A0AAW9QMA8_9CHRO